MATMGRVRKRGGGEVRVERLCDNTRPLLRHLLLLLLLLLALLLLWLLQ